MTSSKMGTMQHFDEVTAKMVLPVFCENNKDKQSKENALFVQRNQRDARRSANVNHLRRVGACLNLHLLLTDFPPPQRSLGVTLLGFTR